MTLGAYKFLRAFNANLLRWFPTCDLQFELERRPGVTTHILGLKDRRDFSVDGPCCVTVNRD